MPRMVGHRLMAYFASSPWRTALAIAAAGLAVILILGAFLLQARFRAGVEMGLQASMRLEEAADAVLLRLGGAVSRDKAQLEAETAALLRDFPWLSCIEVRRREAPYELVALSGTDCAGGVLKEDRGVGWTTRSSDELWFYVSSFPP